MINDNDLLLLASSQNNGTYGVYIDSNGYKTLTPQTGNYTARYREPFVCHHPSPDTIGTVIGLLANENPKKVIFPNCSKVSGRKNWGAFDEAFYRCTSLTSVSFPALTTVTSGYSSAGTRGAFYGAFVGCTSLTSVSFPLLTTATSDGGDGPFFNTFLGCTSLTSVSFPSLIRVSNGNGFDSTFQGAFSECSPSLKVHFKKSLKGTAGLDYNTMNLKSADQVVFDLP